MSTRRTWSSTSATCRAAAFRANTAPNSCTSGSSVAVASFQSAIPASPRWAAVTNSSSIRRATRLPVASGTRFFPMPGMPAPYHFFDSVTTFVAPLVFRVTRRPAASRWCVVV